MCKDGTLLVVVVEWREMEHLVYRSYIPYQVEGIDCDQLMLRQHKHMKSRLINTVIKIVKRKL